MDNRPPGAYADGTPGDNLLQYSQGFNASDNLFSNPNDHNDAGWGVNASAFSNTSLSRAAYQNVDWSNQQQTDHLSPVQSLDRQHSHTPNDTFRRSPANTAAFNPNFSSYGGQNTYNYQQPQYDPTLLATTNQAFKHYQTAYPDHNVEARTIEPQALEQEVVSRGQLEQRHSGLPTATTVSRAANLVDQLALARAIPTGQANGIFHTIELSQLMGATNSERMSAFATVAREQEEWDVNRAALPTYVPRRSRNQLKRLAGDDSALLAKINQKSIKRSRLMSSAISKKGPKTPGDLSFRLGTNKLERRGQVDDSSDSDDDSEYTSDSDVEESPLPSKRPDTPKEAIEYDTVKALWRSKRKAVDANDVRKGLVDFWEVVKTVRDRWKLDAAAVTQAEEKKLKGEIPLLRQRVKDQRDMIECAFKAALKHGNRTILETLSENTSLLFLCYQFLLDRFKAEDVNGALARSILEVMALFNTINNEKLEKTYLVKILPRYIKSGDAKTQFYAKAITSKATGNKASAGGEAQTAQAKSAVAKADPAVGAKRSAATSDAAPPAKKVATAPGKTQPSTAAAGTAKKRLLGDDAAKPAAKKAATSNGVTSKAAETAATKAKPAASKLTTGLFAGLQSAAKKPGTSVKSSATTIPANPAKAATSSTNGAKAAPVSAAPARSVFSFAETMKNLTQPKEEKPAPKAAEKDIPDETPEQKARRLRREARGTLRVHWKSNEDLVEIREFTHDPDEELGHNSSQTRDVADLKGEGRMFKQQHNKMIDDEDDEPAVEVPQKLIDWYEPKPVDFTEVPQDERDRNYYPFGGGKLQPDSAENVERKKYEDNTLMVFYSHSDDIPATPREPEQAITGEPQPITAFAAPEQKFIDRAAQNNLARKRSLGQQSAAPINFDLLKNVLGGAQPQGTAPYQAPPTTQPQLDIQAILAQLEQGGPPKPAPQPAPFPQQPAFNANNPFFPNTPQPSAPPAGQPDIGAILAQLGQANNKSAPQPTIVPPPMPAFLPAQMDPGFLAFLAQHHQQAGGGGGNEAREPPPPGYKTKVCKYWQEGNCLKGDNCTYLHG